MSHTNSTSAGVRYMYQTGFAEDDHDYQLWLVEVKVNGPSPDISTEVRFIKNATASVKQNAVRQIVNDHLAYYEPTTDPLSSANIQISGQPV